MKKIIKVTTIVEVDTKNNEEKFALELGKRSGIYMDESLMVNYIAEEIAGMKNEESVQYIESLDAENMQDFEAKIVEVLSEEL